MRRIFPTVRIEMMDRSRDTRNGFVRLISSLSFSLSPWRERQGQMRGQRDELSRLQRHWSNNNTLHSQRATHLLNAFEISRIEHADRSHCVPRMAGENARAHGARIYVERRIIARYAVRGTRRKRGYSARDRREQREAEYDPDCQGEICTVISHEPANNNTVE